MCSLCNGSDGGSTVSTVLFERFFDRVDDCLLLMKEKGVLACGGAVVSVLDEQSVWDSSELDLVAWRQVLKADGLADCHEFLAGQGYSYVQKDYLHEYALLDVSSTWSVLDFANVLAS